MAYHVNPMTGKPNQCGAKKGRCPFGGPSEHYASQEEARQAYENVMAVEVFSTMKKNHALPSEALQPASEDTVEVLQEKLAWANVLAKAESTTETFMDNVNTIFALQTSLAEKAPAAAYDPTGSRLTGAVASAHRKAAASALSQMSFAAPAW